MISVSLCMIVKNEERILERCLDTLVDICDEIVIVDTGSADATKTIAARYTDKVYDFTWTGSFADARNFAFSKCTMEYIYSADADEVLDEENRKRFKILKRTLLPEIEIVQMKYGNQLAFSTIYNYDEEYRPKLFKRVREFVWEYPVHEAVRLTPVVYDSDIVITHMPESQHTGRDLQVFRRMIDKGIRLDKKMHNLYAKELFVSGSKEDFVIAAPYFGETCEDPERSADEILEAFCAAAAGYRAAGDDINFLKYAMKAVASGGCSEICYELGCFYRDRDDRREACMWFYNAAYETTPILDLKRGDDLAKEAYSELAGN